MDKDKVLPLLLSRRLHFSPDGYEEGLIDQRDADWKRVRLLVEALEAIWDEFDPAAMTPVGRQARDVLHQLGVEVKP